MQTPQRPEPIEPSTQKEQTARKRLALMDQLEPLCAFDKSLFQISPKQRKFRRLYVALATEQIRFETGQD